MAQGAEAREPNVLNVGPGFLTESEFRTHWQRLFPSTEDGEAVPVNADAVNGASVDLHLGSHYYITSRDEPGQLSEESPYLTIPHGEFALLTTREIVRVPDDTIAFITMRLTYKRKGLINVSGFHLDPGFHNKIMYAVYNAGPTDLRLKWKDRIFTVFFATLVQRTTPYSGDYQRFDGLPSEFVQDLGGPPVNIVKLDQRLRDLETQLKIYGAIGLSLLGAIAAVVLTQVL